GDTHQPRQDGLQIEAPIEPVLDLGEVAMRVLGDLHSVVRACHCGLQVAEDGVDGLKLRQLDAGLAAAGDDSLVYASAFECHEAVQAIGDHCQRTHQRLGNELFDR